MNKVEFSVVVPVFNSQDTLKKLYERLSIVFSELKKDFEVIFVEDGCKDNSWKIIKELQEKNPTTITAIKLVKNYGQHNATFCGMDQAKGDFIITIDDDLQVPPEEIKKLILEYQTNNKLDLIYGNFQQKKHSKFRNFGSKLLRYYTKTLFGGPGKGSSFRLFTKEINEQILNHRSTMIFIDELLLWYAGDITFVNVDHAKTQKGKSGYSTSKLFRLFVHVILYSTATPLKIMIYGGFFFAVVNLVIGLIFIYRKMVYQVPIGYTSIIVTILFSTGLLLFFLGIIAKYLSRIYMIQNKKPPYLVKRKLNRKQP